MPTKIVTKNWLDQFNMSSQSTFMVNTGQVNYTIYKYGMPGCASSNSNTSTLLYLTEQDDWDYGLLSTAPAAVSPGSSVTTPSVNATKKTIYNYQCFNTIPVSCNNCTYYSTYASTSNASQFPGIAIPPKVFSVTTENGSGTIQAATVYSYDNYPSGQLASLTATPVNHDPNFNASMKIRGNLTGVTKCSTLPSSPPVPPSPPTLPPPSTNYCSGPTVTYNYDITGQPASMTDANGNTTTYSFADSYTDTTSAPSTNTYLTQVTRPTVNGKTHVSKFSYRYTDGQMTTAIDENNRTTTYAYSDSLDRLTQVTLPADANNGGASAYKQIAYTDTAPTPSITTTDYVCSSSCNPTNGKKAVTQIFDGMWHVTQTQTTDINNPNTSSGLNYTFMKYDGEGHLSQTSNPTWTGSPTAWTKVFYDAFGRKTIQQQQDGSVLQWCYDGVASIGQTNCHAHIGSSPTDTFVDTADESGNDWQRTSDAFDRLIEVEEPNGKSRTPSLETDYTYNLLNDLLTVTQHGQGSETARARTFTYDNLGRLTQSDNSETGWVCYGTTGGANANGSNCASGSGYDGNSNLIAKTDARGITVTYAYDALNREYARNYFQNNVSTGEPSACHQYDAALTVATGDPYPIDEETAEWMAPAGTCPANNSPISVIPSNSFSNRTILAHDVGGRITSETQCPSGSSCGATYTFNYTYDLAGGVTSFNNGLPWTRPASTTTQPGIIWGVALDTSERALRVTVNTQPFTDSAHVGIIQQSDGGNTYTYAALGENGYDVWGNLVAEQAAIPSAPTGAAGIQVVSQHDVRNRIQSEVADGQQVVTVASGSFGAIAVNGLEQSGQLPAVATLTVSGIEQGPSMWYPCGNNTCPQPEYDQGIIYVTVSGHQVAITWASGSTSASLASSLASMINANSSTLGVNATYSGSVVTMFANNSSTQGSSISLSVSETDNTPGGIFSSPSFNTTPSGSTFGGGGTVYNTGTITASLTNENAGDQYGSTIVTTAPISWGSSSTPASLASALMTKINTAASAYVTASLDSTGEVINLKSVATGSSSNYGIQLNITDTTSANNPTYSPSVLPTQGFALASSSPDGGQSAAASYGMIYSYAIPAGGYAVNGNIMAHSDSVMGDWAFMYDTLNRLTVGGAAMNAPSTYANSMACWGYDSFGNRTLAAFFSSTTGDCSQQTTSTASYNSANQVTFVSQGAPISYSAPSGFNYDGAGNVYQDGVNSYAYDSEGRICAVLQPSYMGGAQFRYIYDASGLRVAKGTFTGSFPAKNTVCPAAVPGTNVTLTAQYLLNLGGEQVTELTGSGAWVHSNVWAGSHLDATYDTKGLHFQLADPLGTRRVQTNYQGVVEEYIQSLPFGDNLNPVIPSGAPSTADDATEHHFTGKERDTESGNDDFGARYYSSAMARFLSPDPFLNSGRPDDPQTWNRYSYALNNPLMIVDPTGLYNLVNTCAADNKQCNKDFNTNAANLKAGLAALNKALDNLTPDQVTALGGADAVGRLSQGLAAMGTENDGNSVDVKFGATDSGGAADTTRSTDAQSGSSRFTVTFDPSKTSGAIGFAINADHEGMHVYDERNNLLTAENHPFQFEYRGYQNSSWTAQALEPVINFEARHVLPECSKPA